MASDAEPQEDSVFDFASLMPKFFQKAQSCDETLTFQDFHQLLTMEQLTATQSNEGGAHVIAHNADAPKDYSPSVRPGYIEGKENAAPTLFSERHRLSRRERSSRTISHRKAFVVDLRSFGSILDNDTSMDYKTLKDVHAFWEAADEREATEAIMRRARGEGCKQSCISGRHKAARRSNSRRTTTRLKNFRLELPLCTNEIKSVDKEELEEEEETDESCFTFVKQPVITSEIDFSVPQAQGSQVNNVQGNSTQRDADTSMDTFPDDSGKIIDRTESHNLMPIMSLHNESPKANFVGCLADQTSINLEETAKKFENFQLPEMGTRGREVNEAVEISDGSDSRGVNALQDPNTAIVYDKSSLIRNSPSSHLCGTLHFENFLQYEVGKRRLDFNTNAQDSGANDRLHDPAKATPRPDQSPILKTPLTSPTPPSNPLAAYIIRQDIALQQDIGKKKLDFVSSLNTPPPDLPPSSTKGNDTDVSGTMNSSEMLFKNLDPVEEVVQSSCSKVSTTVTTPTIISHQLTKSSPARHDVKRGGYIQEQQDVLEESVIPTISSDQPAKSSFASHHVKRRRAMKEERRDSLEGAGTKWDGQVRRSTRIRSRPLEWWRGERFLRARVHRSLVTVIGIKYSSPPPCWPKRGAKLPKFKVESFVSEKYARKVEFAALY